MNSASALAAKAPPPSTPTKAARGVPSKPSRLTPMPDALRMALDLGDLAVDLGVNGRGTREDFVRIRRLLQQLRCTR